VILYDQSVCELNICGFKMARGTTSTPTSVTKKWGVSSCRLKQFDVPKHPNECGLSQEGLSEGCNATVEIFGQMVKED